MGQLGQFIEGELIDGEIAFKTLDGGIAGYPIDLHEISQRGPSMGVGKRGKRVVVDRGDRAAVVGEIEGKGLAGVERAVWFLTIDRLGQFAGVERNDLVVLAVGGIASN